MNRIFPKTVGESHVETTRMARRLFLAPAPRRMVPPLVVFSIMESYLLVFPQLDAVRIFWGSLAIGVPAFVAALTTQPIASVLGGRMYLRRSVLMAFLGLIFLGAFELVSVAALSIYGVATRTLYADHIEKVAILAYGGVLWTREVILSATSHSQYLRSLPAASVHPVLGLVGLALFIPLSVSGVLIALAVFAIFFLSAIAYAEIAKRPLLRSFGADGLKLLRSTLDVYGDREEQGVIELERFFDSISVPARVRIAGVAFRSGAKPKSLLIAPTVHPGPMGLVSGSDLPTKIAKDLAEVTPNILVAHGPTTHDENPATTAEVRKVADAVRFLLGQAKFGGEAGQSRRATFERASALAQAFGDTVMIVATFAPNPSDDIDSATGHAAVQEAKLAGAADAIFVDAHNCLEPGVGLTLFGSHASHEIVQAAKLATEAALKAPRGKLRVGYGHEAGIGSRDQGLGERGIEVLVVEVGGQRTGYVLFDGNNMVPGMRELVLERIRPRVPEGEAMTTDNHSVNLTMDGFNPVGAAMDKSTVLSFAESATERALADLEAVEVATFSGDISGFRIFGPQTASRLTTAISSTFAVLRPALYVTLSGAVAIAALALILL